MVVLWSTVVSSYRRSTDNEQVRAYTRRKYRFRITVRSHSVFTYHPSNVEPRQFGFHARNLRVNPNAKGTGFPIRPVEIDDFDGELAIRVCRANQLSVTRYHRVLSARKYRPIVPIGFHSASLTVVSPSFSSSLLPSFLPSFFSSFPFLSSSSLAVPFPPLSFVLKHKIRSFSLDRNRESCSSSRPSRRARNQNHALVPQNSYPCQRFLSRLLLRLRDNDANEEACEKSEKRKIRWIDRDRLADGQNKERVSERERVVGEDRG